ncbi:hypothetical protein SSX86_001941 [Deinandra increscens subsp. villosa]|uniref:Serpin domain-containing protein n=1 Tax=Deinandra increscens subsp. villosa TaxID=3103831 RepID=A0AAP0HEX8_9ASTR
MARIFRPSTFNNLLRPLLQKEQPYANAIFNNTFRQRNRFFKSSPLTVLSTDLQQSVTNQTHVSTALATHLLSKKYPRSNVVFSPLSIHAVLSLLAAGSKGKTHDQLLTFLRANSTDELNSLSSDLVSSILADGSPMGGPRLSFANGVWVEKNNVSLKPSFKEVVDTFYKAGCKQVDFTKADEVANEVNLWAEKQTNGLIKKVISANDIHSLTWLIFANAVYFKGTWLEKFDASWTEKHDFHLLDGKKVRVPFMTSTKHQFVSEYDDFKILGLPYLQGQDEREFTMYIVLPNAKDGLQSLVEKIGSTSNFFNRYIPCKRVEVGEFLIPKYKMSFDFEASKVLKELGLVLPFSDKDGMTEMVDSPIAKNVFVSSIHHKSIVEVNEEGTEAAAVTACVMPVGCSRWTKYDKIDFVADHPFLFVIREDVTGVVLFMGQVVDPRAG